MVAVKKLAYYLIPLIVLVLIVLWQFGPDGLFEGIKVATDVATDLAPNITVGAEEVTGEKVMLPKEHEDAVRKLGNTINDMINSGNTNCFANYGGFPELEDEGTMISLKECRIEISRKRQLVEDLNKEFREKMEGFKPCVISGELEAENFYKNFLENEPQLVGAEPGEFPLLEIPYKQKVDSIVISADGINFGTGFKDFEDEGWLYQDDKGLICFFPTRVDGRKYCSWSERGLDDDCLEEYKNYFEKNKCS